MDKIYLIETEFGNRFLVHAKNRIDAFYEATKQLGSGDPVKMCVELEKGEIESLVHVN